MEVTPKIIWPIASSRIPLPLLLPSPLGPFGSAGHLPWISTLFSSVRWSSPLPRWSPSCQFIMWTASCWTWVSLFPLASEVILQSLSSYTRILPKCVTDPSPHSGFDFSVGLLLFHISPRVCIWYLVWPPNLQYVFKTVVHKHLHLIDGWFGGFTAIEKKKSKKKKRS